MKRREEDLPANAKPHCEQHFSDRSVFNYCCLFLDEKKKKITAYWALSDVIGIVVLDEKLKSACF